MQQLRSPSLGSSGELRDDSNAHGRIKDEQPLTMRLEICGLRYATWEVATDGLDDHRLIAASIGRSGARM